MRFHQNMAKFFKSDFGRPTWRPSKGPDLERVVAQHFLKLWLLYCLGLDTLVASLLWPKHSVHYKVPGTVPPFQYAASFQFG